MVLAGPAGLLARRGVALFGVLVVAVLAVGALGCAARLLAWAAGLLDCAAGLLDCAAGLLDCAAGAGRRLRGLAAGLAALFAAAVSLAVTTACALESRADLLGMMNPNCLNGLYCFC